MQSQTTHVHSHTTSIIPNSRAQRLEALKQRHASVDRRLQKQQISPSSSDLDLKQLKAEKLKLKDEMELLKSVS